VHRPNPHRQAISTNVDSKRLTSRGSPNNAVAKSDLRTLPGEGTERLARPRSRAIRGACTVVSHGSATFSAAPFAHSLRVRKGLEQLLFSRKVIGPKLPSRALDRPYHLDLYRFRRHGSAARHRLAPYRRAGLALFCGPLYCSHHLALTRGFDSNRLPTPGRQRTRQSGLLPRRASSCWPFPGNRNAPTTGSL
jgi:hypothetical protein